MKYTCEVTIDLPRGRMIELFDSTENLVKWQPGLQSTEHISGEAGQPGAKMRFNYKENGRKTTMVETIITRNFPDEFVATYEAPGVFNCVVNWFLEEDPEKTRWVMESEFQFKGMMVVFGLVMRKAFPRQTLKEMKRFKEFAESA